MIMFSVHLIWLLGLIWIVTASVTAPRLPTKINARDGNTTVPRKGPCVALGDPFPDQTLRILPLGGSITWGQQSPSGNGYRKFLRDMLIANGASVNMVRKVKHGTMGDNDNEGWLGLRVDQISTHSNNDLAFQPNLILINAGTNDVAQGYFLGTVNDRLESMINKLLDNIPDTVAIVSTLLVNRNTTKQDLTENVVNPKYVDLVKKMAEEGKLVHLADMSPVTMEMINARDGTHPTDYGYTIMADVWHKAIQDVYEKCWITPRANVAGLNDSDTADLYTRCDVGTKNNAVPIEAQEKISTKGYGVHYCDMRGSGSDDLILISKNGTLNYHANNHMLPTWDEYGAISEHSKDLISNYSIDDIHLANLDGDGKCDFLLVDLDDFSIRMIRNDYSYKKDTFAWTDMGIVSKGAKCESMKGPGSFDLSVRFADLDGDGKADLLCLNNTDTIFGYKNNGLNNWSELGLVHRVSGDYRADWRFADVNGDGRADFLQLGANDGSVQAWLNRGFIGASENGETYSWIRKGEIFGGGYVGGEDVYLANINGYGRADSVYVYPDNATAYAIYNVCT